MHVLGGFLGTLYAVSSCSSPSSNGSVPLPTSMYVDIGKGSLRVYAKRAQTTWLDVSCTFRPNESHWLVSPRCEFHKIPTSLQGVSWRWMKWIHDFYRRGITLAILPPRENGVLDLVFPAPETKYTISLSPFSTPDESENDEELLSSVQE